MGSSRSTRVTSGNDRVAEPYVIREASREDAQRIAPLLRDKDRQEIETASGLIPEVYLPQAFTLPGEKLIAETASGKPIMIAGVHPTHSSIAATIWLVGTPLLEAYALPSVRMSLRRIERWHRTYPLLWNQALESNDLHVRWLRLLGFSFLRRVEHRGSQFLEFARHQPTCASTP